MPRECGDCTLCCKVMAIPATGSKQGEWCQFCDPKAERCTVHTTRPQQCRDFSCLWLVTEDLPQDLRPDRCRVVLATTKDGDTIVAHVDPSRPDAWRVGHIGRVLRKVSRLIAVCGEKRLLVTDTPPEPGIFPVLGATPKKEEDLHGV